MKSGIPNNLDLIFSVTEYLGLIVSKESDQEFFTYIHELFVSIIVPYTQSIVVIPVALLLQSVFIYPATSPL